MWKHGHPCDLCRIELEHVSVTANGEELIRDVNLHIHCGEISALIGVNGAGKTTLLRALLGETPYRGTVRHVREDGSLLRSVRIGYVPQRMAFDRGAPVTALDFFIAAAGGRAVWRGLHRAERKAALRALATTGCSDLADRRIGALSGGELQRMLLALAITPDPDLLLLDEPDSGVDRNGLENFYGIVTRLQKERHLAVLLVSHDFDVIRRYAGRIVLLRRSVLDEGPPEQVFAGEAFAREFGGIRP